jgi:hypothetical protein
MTHLTTMSAAEWAAAGIFRQVAMIRDLGERATDYWHLSCECGAIATADTHGAAMDWRVTHETGA